MMESTARALTGLRPIGGANPLTEAALMRASQLAPPSALWASPREVPTQTRSGVTGSNAKEKILGWGTPELAGAQVAAASVVINTPPGLMTPGEVGKLS